MAQPPYIPQTGEPDDLVHLRNRQSKISYSSPEYAPPAWRANRPGDIAEQGNPTAPGFGNQGPDQGYLLKLLADFQDQLFLKAGESRQDVLAGCGQLALKRASISRRAPIKEDLEVSFLIFGFLYKNPPQELVDLRQRLLRGLAHGEFAESSRLERAVPNEILKLNPAEIKATQRSDWKSIFSVSSA